MLVLGLPCNTATKMVRSLKKFILIFVVYANPYYHITIQALRNYSVRYKAAVLSFLSRTRSAYTTPFVGSKERLATRGALGLDKGSQMGSKNLSQVFLLIPMFWCTAQVNIKIWNLLFPLMERDFILSIQQPFGVWIKWCYSLGWMEIGYKLAKLRLRRT